MAQKKEHEGEIKGMIKDFFSATIVSHIKDGIKSLFTKAQEIAYQTEKKIVEYLFASIILLCGIIFIAVSLALMISDYLKVGSQWGFFVVGLILVIVALLFKDRIKKTKYYNKWN